MTDLSGPGPGWYPDPSRSADLRWWNGTAWTSHTLGAAPSSPQRSREVPKLVHVAGAVWLGLVGAWIPAWAALVDRHAPLGVILGVVIPLGGLAVVSTLLFGGCLGYGRRWREAGVASLAGAGMLLFWYAAVTLTAPDPTNQNDHAAGVGVVILAVPALLLVSLVLGQGAGVGRAVLAIRGRLAGRPR